MLKKARKALSYYSLARRTKRAQSLRSINLAWRAIAIVLIALAIFIIYDYLQGKYPEAVSYTPLAAGALPQVFLLGDKLFTWFLIGVFFGVIAISVINEGEYFIAVSRIARDIEREAERAVKGISAEAEKGARTLAPLQPGLIKTTKRKGKKKR
jgi:hypothetical protein